MAPITRVQLTAFTVVTAVIGIGVYLSARDGDAKSVAQAQGGGVGQLVRDNSRRLNTVPNSDVTFVEFLDFECEACGAAFPMVEKLRSEYGDRVNFVMRYFPLQSRFNAERAARAVEAAAQQGKLEAINKKMYETQTQWAEQRTPADSVFRGFATELGLDMATFDAAYNDPAILDRVKLDVADGKALGVQGTPTFYLDGNRVEFRTYEDLSAAIQQALK